MTGQDAVREVFSTILFRPSVVVQFVNVCIDPPEMTDVG
jgi:hypothetical protein